MKAKIIILLFTIAVQSLYGQITLHTNQFSTNQEELIADYSGDIQGTWTTLPGLGQRQSTAGPRGDENEETSLPFTPEDSLIHFEGDGTYWTNDSINYGIYTIDICPFSGISYVDSTGIEVTQWSFNLNLGDATYLSSISEGKLSIQKDYENWSWVRYLVRKLE